jgi:hypothetical protein
MENLKYIVFFVALFAGVPILVILGCSRRQYLRCLVFAAVFLSYETNRLSLNFFSVETYRGTARGMEITVADMLFWALLMVLLLLYRQRFRFFPRGSLLYLPYYFWCALSIFNAANQLYSFFELWKMLMMWICFLVISNYLSITRDLEPILKGLGTVVILSFFVVLNQKYFLGRYQTPGVFAHQNTAAMYMGMIGPLFLTRCLEERNNRWDNAFYISAFVFSGAIAFFSFSRGAMLFYPLGCAVALIFSLGHRVNKRKILVVAFITVGASLGLMKMAPRIIARLKYAPETSKLTRVRLAKTAVIMANDKKIIGIGINNWGIKINPPYSYAFYRDELNYDEDFKDGLVETIYLMTAAECGWVGLGLLLALFGGFFLLNMLNWFLSYRTDINYLAAGISGGLVSVYGQSLLEWVLKQSPPFYELMIIFAIISAMNVLLPLFPAAVAAGSPPRSRTSALARARARRKQGDNADFHLRTTRCPANTERAHKARELILSPRWTI